MTASPSFIYRPDAIDSGRRSTRARLYRAGHAIQRAAERHRAHPAIGLTYFGSEVITPHTIDGIHSAPTTDRMFGPTEARSGRGPSWDHLRRAQHFDIAADRIVATTTLAEFHHDAPSQQRERAYCAAYISERSRKMSASLAAEQARTSRCEHEWHSYEYENGTHGQTCRLCGSTDR